MPGEEVEVILGPAERGLEEGVEEGLQKAQDSVLHRPPRATPCGVQKRLGFNIPRKGAQ